jgi:glycosyltransferase involved in cell wall biosynthesis
VSLYQGAAAFVFPSLHEAFGLPALEAMACGAPVVTSSTTCLPELAGDAAITVDPTNTREIEDAMFSIVTDKRLSEELRERGRLRAGRFSWNNTAREVLAVYRASEAG